MTRDEYYGWSRWHLLNITTPSGKMMFSCKFCGHMTPAPSSCPDLANRDDGNFKYMYGLSCEELERLVIDNRKINISDHLKALYAEDALRPFADRWCGECRGWGCQHCVGTGQAQFDITDILRQS